MNSLKTLLGFWTAIAIPYSFAVVILLFAFNWWGMKVAIALLLIGVYLHFSFWSYLKSQILAALPDDFTWQDISPENYSPFLDIDWLREYIQELEYIGFVRLKDYQLTPESGGNPSDFARLFSHPQLYCFAEIFQSFPQ